jgi:hypothetical protein
MRVPLMPLALSLAVGGLLYAAYQGNKRLVEGVASRPAVASPAARSADVPRVAPADDATAVTQDSQADVDLSQLDERCAAIAATAAASAEAVESGVSFDEFVRRPVVAFVNDPALRSELELVARRRYEETPESPATAQRDALRDGRCF